MRIFVSSTSEDLKQYRDRAIKELRREHCVVCMEDYVAEDRRPLDKCLEDVAGCDLYVGFFAWRYGFVPPGRDQSITELEYREAVKRGVTALAFLLDETVLWAKEYCDKGPARQRIVALRKELSDNKVAPRFSNPEDLALEVLAAVRNEERKRQSSASRAHTAPARDRSAVTVEGDSQLLVLRFNTVPAGLGVRRDQVQGPQAEGVPVLLRFWRYGREETGFYRGWGRTYKDALAWAFHGTRQCGFYYRRHKGGEAPLLHCNVMPFYAGDRLAPKHLCELEWLNRPGLLHPPWAETKVWANNLFFEKHRHTKVTGVIRMSKDGDWQALCDSYALFLRECYRAVQDAWRLLNEAVAQRLIASIAPSSVSDEAWQQVLATQRGHLQVRSEYLDADLARMVAQVYEAHGEPVFELVPWRRFA